MYNQPGFLRTLQRKWERGQLSTRPIRSAAREIILTEVRSGRERLVLEYESIPTTGALNLPDFRDPQVSRRDSMYSSTVVYEQGGSSNPFASWRRYVHAKDDTDGYGQGNFSAPSTSDPYGTVVSGVGGATRYRYNEVAGSDLIFKHGFLESPRLSIGASMPPGDLYEIRTTIRTATFIQGRGGVLYDINLATGDNTGVAANPSSRYYDEEDYQQSRGQSVFSTFPQAVKWHSLATVYQTGGGTPPNLRTSNFFMMPNQPTAFGGFHIQVGAANSDQDFAQDLYAGSPPTDQLEMCQSYYHTVGYNEPGKLNKGDDIPQNFGVGAPWHMMKNFYAELEGFDDHCAAPSNARKF